MADRLRRKWWIAPAIGFVLALALVACSSEQASDTMSRGGDDGLAGSAAPDGAPAVGENTSWKPADSERPGSAGPSGQTLPPLLGRKMIRTATVDVASEDVGRAFQDAINIAESMGGFVASSSFGHGEDRTSASITIRVPSDRYQETLLAVRNLGDVREEKSSANDVTEEYTDLESRLRNLRSIEARYIDLLAQAQNIEEILVVQDRLNATRAEIEQVQGRINLLESQTSLATVTVHLASPPAVPVEEGGGATGPFEVAREAFAASLTVLLGIATVAIAVAAFSWWLVPLVLIVLYATRRQWRSLRT